MTIAAGIGRAECGRPIGVSIEQGLELGQVGDHVVRRPALVLAKRVRRVPDTASEPGRAHADGRGAGDIGGEVVTDVDHLVCRKAETLEYGREDLGARLANADLVGDHDFTEVLE